MLRHGAAVSRWFAPVVAAGALLLLARLVQRTGPGELLAQARGLGAVLPVAFVLTGFRYVLKAQAWRLTLEPAERPGLANTTVASVAGDSLGYLSWAGPFTSEPMKVFMLRRSVAPGRGIIGSAIERAIYTAASVGIVVAALGVLAHRTHHWEWWVGGLASAGLALVSGPLLLRAFVPSRRRERPTWRAARAMARRLLGDAPAALAGIVGLAVAQHLLLVVEACLILRALGSLPDFETLLLLEGLAKVLAGVGTVVPGRVGVYEGGSLLLADRLGVVPLVGLNLAIARRLRALAWGLVGVVLVIVHNRRELAVQRGTALGTSLATGRQHA